MKRLRGWCVRAGCLLLAGCLRPTTPPAAPAVLTDPSPSARAELSRVVGKALNQPPILLADDALMREDVLLIERIRSRDATGQLLNGRALDRPERFRLNRQGAACLLIHERSGRRWTLNQPCAARSINPA